MLVIPVLQCIIGGHIYDTGFVSLACTRNLLKSSLGEELVVVVVVIVVVV